ncbi:MAG: c-type cytochrome [Gammaproteobacteria bacterium]|nr:c-type cytochrome [Gammaproteobacteria bacterium]
MNSFSKSVILSAVSILCTLHVAKAEKLGGELDSLEVRPTLVKPQLSLPTKLTEVHVASPGEFFVPPNVADIPNDKYGDMVRMGREIFVNTQISAGRYVGNALNCQSCHLQEGRKPYAMPIWGAFGMYPMFRNKTRSVVTYEQRIQDCFRFSLNGIPPSVDSPEMQALVAYSHWLSRGAPIGVELPGRSLPGLMRTEDPSPQRGEIVYTTRCAMCHGELGLGKKTADGTQYAFPPLWGPDSFNKGAGIFRVRTAAQYIKANMPLGQGFTISDQEALDVAAYIWIQDRPKDPRVGYILDFLLPRTGAP